MKTYTTLVKFISPYLQAKFSEKAKSELNVRAGKKSNLDDDEQMQNFLYKDDGGIYIPSIQFKMALVNAGKSIKQKPYGNLKNIVRAYFFIEPEKIYIKKEKPDFVKTSYPSRKDGLRVKVCHPAFNPGLQVEFKLICTNDDVDQRTIELLVSKAGLEYGIGGWRPEHGRFDVVNIKN
jgi:hypothetical protein